MIALRPVSGLTEDPRNVVLRGSCRDPFPPFQAVVLVTITLLTVAGAAPVSHRLPVSFPHPGEHLKRWKQ